MFVNKSANKIERPETLNKDNNLSVEYLIQLMDSPDVKLDYTTPKSKAEIGAVDIFVRSYYGNYVLADKTTNQANITHSVENEKLPDEMTLNDYVLFICSTLIRTVYKGTDDTTLALNAFPTPFGVIHDPVRDCDVAIIQLCVNVEQLLPAVENLTYIPVEEVKLPDYIKDHFKLTKSKEE